jgi:cysteine-rich repeat protein
VVEHGYECPIAGELCTNPWCGNGEVEYWEACDDGNTVDGDGCSADCQMVELGYKCPIAGQLCTLCGNGVLEFGEICDDGNTASCDACSWDCTTITERADAAACTCGDGIVDPGEECDNGAANTPTAYDGCTPGCTLGPHCGDGMVQHPQEACDDGNRISHDGCSGVCQHEI